MLPYSSPISPAGSGPRLVKRRTLGGGRRAGPPSVGQPAEGMDSSFGAPRPEPIQSIRDSRRVCSARPRKSCTRRHLPHPPRRPRGSAAGTSRPGCGGVPRTSGPDAADAPFRGGGKRGYAGGTARHEAAGIPSLYHARRRPRRPPLAGAPSGGWPKRRAIWSVWTTRITVPPFMTCNPPWM